MHIKYAIAIFLAATLPLSADTIDSPAQVYRNPDPQPPGYNDFDEFGMAMALHGDLALIGAPTAARELDGKIAQAGRAFLFDLESGELLLSFDDPSPEDEGDFGSSVALNGDFALVASNNSIELFDISDSTGGAARHLFTIPAPDPDDKWWGNEAALGFWGGIFLARNIDENGARLLEVYDIETRQKVGQIVNPDNDPTSDFGRRLAIDGNRLLVGDPAAGEPETNYVQGPGAVYVFDLTTLSHMHTFTRPDPDQHPYAVGYQLAAQNGQALTTAHTEMHGTYPEVYYFDIETGALLHTFRAENPTQVWYFGQGLALTENRIFLAYTHNQYIRVARARGQPIDPSLMTPRIYVYDRRTFELISVMRNRDPALENHELGNALVADENRILIGRSHNNLSRSIERDPAARMRGEVHAYSRPSARRVWD